MKKIYKKYFGEILIATAALSYCFEWYFIRNIKNLGYESLDITFVKLFVSSIIILVFYSLFNRKIYKKNKLKIKDYSLLLILAILSIYGNTFFNEAIIHTSIANVMVMLYLSVFWTFFLSLFFFKEKFSVKKIGFTILAFFGIVLVLIKDIANLSLELGIGELYAFVVSFLLAVSVIITKQMSHISGFYRILILFLISSVLMLLYIIDTNGIHYLKNYINKDFLLYGSVLAITSGLMGRGLRDVGTKYVPASIVLVIMLLEPIGQVSTGYFFGGETVSVINIIGMAIVFYTIIGISKKEA